MDTLENIIRTYPEGATERIILQAAANIAGDRLVALARAWREEALAEALAAAQAKALSALEKAYVRGALDAEQFSARMTEIGCTDTVDKALLLAALDTLKEHGQTEPGYTEKRQTEKPTEAQAAYIAKLADQSGFTAPDLAGVTRAQASEIIDSLRNGTYDASKWELPFS